MKKTVSILMWVGLLAPPVFAEECQVYKVSDGDTIKVECQGRRVTIRLYGVDTPEKVQPYGREATAYTAQAVLHRMVDVQVIDTDRYGRSVAVVTLGGVSLNAMLVQNGYAWVYERYCLKSFCSDFKRFQWQSRKLGLGLWADAEPLAPWDYRRARRQGRTPKTAVVLAYSGVYHGNVKSRVFHGLDCRYYDCRNCSQPFQTKKEALDARFRPHKECVN